MFHSVQQLVMEEESLLDILDFHPINGSHHAIDDLDLSGNSSEFIFPPEKEGSAFAACASIVLKSDLKVSKRFFSVLKK